MNEIELIRQWSIDRGLDLSSSDKQIIKLTEELGELAEAHNKGRELQAKDSLGDMFVVMTVYAQQNGYKIEDCIKSAYEEIKNRKGETKDGVFIKEGD